jgi:hypothetical protein
MPYPERHRGHFASARKKKPTPKPSLEIGGENIAGHREGDDRRTEL